MLLLLLSWRHARVLLLLGRQGASWGARRATHVGLLGRHAGRGASWAAHAWLLLLRGLHRAAHATTHAWLLLLRGHSAAGRAGWVALRDSRTAGRQRRTISREEALHRCTPANTVAGSRIPLYTTAARIACRAAMPSQPTTADVRTMAGMKPEGGCAGCCCCCCGGAMPCGGPLGGPPYC